MDANRLADQLSPYLLQHARNPVRWWPWCREAFEAAGVQDKPVFLSIGYATCHWCHVMEKESFSDADTAAILNQAFVCIKVDREERPDVDAVYMAACQVLGGNCGWPLTIVMTPDRKPFFAATYLPRTNSFGRPGLMEISRKIASLWKNERQMVVKTADQVAKVLAGSFSFASMTGELEAGIFQRACRQLESAFDTERGGFNGAPKFPMAHRLVFLIRQAARAAKSNWMQMATTSLEAMRRGGIWDHVGLGFHRYSTDADWILPHFEKMLYDQALLAMAYLEAYQVTGDLQSARTAQEIFTYVADKLTDRGGAFFTAQDADSQGEEGLYYLWRHREFSDLVGTDDPVPWTGIFNLEVEGNFVDQATGRPNGLNVLYLSKSWKQWAAQLNLDLRQLERRWESLRRSLYLQREQRPAPLTDDKVLADWNGLMIAALAMGARVLAEGRYRQAAARAADFIWTTMVSGDGQLCHAYRGGRTMGAGFSSDYAYFIAGLLELYRTSFDAAYLDKAVVLQNVMDQRFYDPVEGGYFLAPKDSTELPAIPKDLFDGALPSVNGVALANLARLYSLTGRPAFGEKADLLSRAFGGEVERQPASFTNFLCSLELVSKPVSRVVIVTAGAEQNVDSILARIDGVHAPELAVMVKTPRNGNLLEKIAPFTARLGPEGQQVRIYLVRDGAGRAVGPHDPGLDEFLKAWPKAHQRSKPEQDPA